MDDRKVIDGILWVLRSGRPWRQLPDRFGHRTTCYNRFVRWQRAGIWDLVIAAMANVAAKNGAAAGSAKETHVGLRGAETRNRILRTAIRLFAVHGIEAVSTRQIAAAESVPPASLRYYFVDKQGLHEACIRYVDTLALELIGPSIDSAERLIKNRRVSIDRIVQTYCDIQASCADLMIGAENGTIALLVIRYDLPTDHALRQPDSPFGQRIFACYIALIMRLGKGIDQDAAFYLATMLHGQLIAICASRPRLELSGWTATPERIATIKQLLRELTAAALRSKAR